MRVWDGHGHRREVPALPLPPAPEAGVRRWVRRSHTRHESGREVVALHAPTPPRAAPGVVAS